MKSHPAATKNVLVPEERELATQVASLSFFNNFNFMLIVMAMNIVVVMVMVKVKIYKLLT